jgi:hypothetical protein
MQRRIAIAVALAGWIASVVAAQRPDVFVESMNHPAIAYLTGATDDAIAALNRRIREGEVALRFDEANGYLRSVLEALEVPVESQTLVFSPTSLQASAIQVDNPRALYFNDTVAIGWIRGADLLEAAVQDPRQGVILYELAQEAGGTPQFRRNNECLQCHLAWDTLGVPGMLTLSTAPRLDDKAYALGFVTDHRSPFRERWGGWYVTGSHGSAGHMGNVPVAPEDRGKRLVASPTRELKSVEGIFDLTGYLTPHSDVVALLVLNHQAHAGNLITRLAWEARVAAAGGAGGAARVRDAAASLVDYFLFVDEIPLMTVRGYSGFTETFSARGPRDGQGRSLRQLDLQRRLFRYRCSYMIYSPAFDALPPAARDAVYGRLWSVLSGQDRSPRYRSLSLADRRAIVEILRATKTGLPDVFNGQVVG